MQRHSRMDQLCSKTKEKIKSLLEIAGEISVGSYERALNSEAEKILEQAGKTMVDLDMPVGDAPGIWSFL